MSFKKQDDRSNLFLMRLHAKSARKLDDLNRKPWSGTVQRVVSGETYDFCGWAELIECLDALLDDSSRPEGHPTHQADNATDGNSMSGNEK